MKNQIVEILIRRDGLNRSEAEEELRRVRAEFDPLTDDEINDHGIRILRDEKVLVNGELTLAGRDDAAWGNTSNRMHTDELLSGADLESFIIVADHQPIEYDECSANGADLELSGHTHAGQIWPVGPLTELGGDLNYGLYHKEEPMIRCFLLWSLRAPLYDLILADIGFMVLISQHSGFFHYQPERRDNFL